MSVRDWINFPRTEEGWHTRANAWMNELRDCVTTLVTDTSTLRADVDALGNTSSYTIAALNITLGAGTTGEFTEYGDWVIARLHVVVGTTAVAGPIILTLPVQAHATWRNKFTGMGVTGDDKSAAIQYHGVSKIEATGTEISIWTSNAGQLWFGTVPAVGGWAANDTIDATVMYRKA